MQVPRYITSNKILLCRFIKEHILWKFDISKCNKIFIESKNIMVYSTLLKYYSQHIHMCILNKHTGWLLQMVLKPIRYLKKTNTSLRPAGSSTSEKKPHCITIPGCAHNKRHTSFICKCDIPAAVQGVTQQNRSSILILFNIFGFLVAWSFGIG